MSEEEPRYNDDSIDDDDRLLRAFPHDMYSPPLAEGEQASVLGTAVLPDRLSSQGFQVIPDKHSKRLGMSVYLERLLEGGGPEDLLVFLSESAKGPLSLVVMLAGAVRKASPLCRKEPPEGPALGIAMAVVNEPFGSAHANVTYPEENGRKFSGGTKNWMVQNAQVLIPELPGNTSPPSAEDSTDTP